MKKILLSTSVVTGVLLAALIGSRAFFSDTETSTDNKFEAGAFDLKIDNTSYYNGVLHDLTTWILDNLPGHLFFNFSDLKPDDWGEDTISLHVENDAYACMKITKTANDDNTCTEPEKVDDPTCNEPDVDLDDGELDKQISILFWADDGDNVLETGDEEESIFKQGTLDESFDGQVVPLADASTNLWTGGPGPMEGTKTYYIGKAWCFGTLTTQPLPQDGKIDGWSPATNNNGDQVVDSADGGYLCDGTLLDNAAQSDLVKADVEFSAVQARHNTSFQCVPNGSPKPSTTPSPTPVACIDDADVMLVLDRSGSINSTELTDLKNAATAFVTALSPSVAGAHVGEVSFSTNATLDVHLTDNAATVNAAINGLVAGGFTNLYQGLLFSGTELSNPGDGHDRPEPGSPDHLVVITDGNPNRPQPEATARAQALVQATALKAGGATIYVVGVGSDVDSVYLTTIASPGQYYSSANYTDLATALAAIGTCPSPTPTTAP